MIEKILYMGLYLVGVIISAASQILLKKSAEKEYPNKIREYLNPYVIIAYGIFFLATLVSVFAFKKIDASMGPILGASGYIFVALFSWIFFKEKISKLKMLGLAIIVTGIVVYAL